MAESRHRVAEAKQVARASDYAPARPPGHEGLAEEAFDVERGPGGDLAARHAALLGDPRLISRFSQNQRVRLVQQLSRDYGNSHVARVIAQFQQGRSGPDLEDSTEWRGREPESVTSQFSMAGSSHTIKASLANDEFAVTMASFAELPLRKKLTAQKATESALVDSTHGAEKQRHVEIFGEIEELENWFERMKDGIVRLANAAENKAKIKKSVESLVELLVARIVALGTTYGLKDLVHKVFGIDKLFDDIDGQVRQLNKHIANEEAVGDGHSNSAMAAEALGWKHKSGQLHRTRGVTAEAVLSNALNQLNLIQQRHGVQVSKEPTYLDGVRELADTRKALGEPRKYLEDKGLLAAFGIM